MDMLNRFETYSLYIKINTFVLIQDIIYFVVMSSIIFTNVKL